MSGSVQPQKVIQTRKSSETMAETNVAQEVLEKVESSLECGICFDTYTDPKVLPCFHVFCMECLKKSVEKSRDKKNLSCPNCRRSVPLPPNGIEGLQSAFHIGHLFEIRDTLTKSKDTEKTMCEKCKQSIATGYCRDCCKFVCEDCKKVHKLWNEELGGHKIVSMEEIQTQATNLVPPKKKELFCKKHPEERLKIFCETCQELACFYCTIRDHQNHQHDTVPNSFQKNRDEIERELLPVKEQREKLKKTTKDFDTRAGEISENEANLGAEIRKRIDHFCQLLQHRKTELLTQLEQTAQQKQKRLGAQKELVDLRLAQLDNCIGYVEGSLRTDSPGEILSLKATTLQQLHLLVSDFKDDMVEPKERATLNLQMTDLEKTCKQLGEVIDSELACPEKCSVTGTGVEFATVEEKQELTLKVVGATGGDVTISPNAVVAQLVNTSDQTVTRCNVSEAKKSECQIDYTPKKRGRHQLHLKIEGQHVQNSPFSVIVMPELVCFQKPIATFPNLQGAWGIGITSTGQLVVGEANANRVTILTQDGVKVRSFGTEGSANGQFNYPGGIAIDNEDYIYVTDANNHRIQKFRTDGSFVAAVGGRGGNQLQFSCPYGITFNKCDGHLYVCDTSNNRIQVLTTGLQYSKTIGSQGQGDGKMNSTWDIAFDSKGQMYVADSGNKRVLVFSAAGQYSYTFGADRLYQPYGITVDAAGRVYVVEHTAHRISVFTQAGEHIRSFEPLIKYPLRITIETENMHFFVSGFNSNNLLKF